MHRTSALVRFRQRVRELTPWTRGRSFARIVPERLRYLIGRRGYFGFCETPSTLRDLDNGSNDGFAPLSGTNGSTGRTVLRSCAVSVSEGVEARTAGSPHGSGGSARPRHSPILSLIHSSEASPPCTFNQSSNSTIYRVRTRMYGGVGGVKPQGSPYLDFYPLVVCKKIFGCDVFHSPGV